MNILVSACLLGADCKYSGGNNFCPALAEKLKACGCGVVPVCPEIYGGLPTPRPPAERQGERVTAENGADVTARYTKGAEVALKLAQITGCTVAIFKKNSPSCGFGTIYDGTFTHTKTQGNGVTAELLAKHGIKIYNEDNFEEILQLK